ncbi:MAG: DUF3999 domain-containing protein [bacterium]|nr:DUF3999 domain-containing protein [bacterium]
MRNAAFWLRCLVGLMWCAVAATALCDDRKPVVEREVVPGGPGGNRLGVDVELLSGAARDLRDLRLLAADGEEVPYLLLEQLASEREWQQGTILPLRRTKKSSGFEIDLGELRVVDRVRISGLPAPFLKRVRLEAGGDRARWTVLHEQATLFDLPDEGLKLLELAFEPGEYRYIRFVWSDRSSGRLPLPARVAARLLEGGSPPPPLLAQLPFEKRASEPGHSRYRVILPAAGLPITGLELAVGSPYVLRQARVSEARLAGSEIRPHVLGEVTLRKVVHDDLVASKMEIPIAEPSETEVEIEVEDGDNLPLELTMVTARFASQPWIYFESPDGRPLRARYGADELVAPFYDLEALRGTLGARDLASSVALARFGEVHQVLQPRQELSIADAVGVGASLDLSGFQKRRAIEPSEEGLVAVRLDAEVLAGSRRLRDLRIVDSSSAQVPYILESLGEPTVLDLAEPVPMPDKAGERQSVYALSLPYDGLPAARLTLSTSGRVFERRVRLVREETRNPRDPPMRVPIDEQMWLNSDPARDAPALSFRLPERSGVELLLIVDEGDNSPLQLGQPKLYLPSYRLRFIRRDDDSLWLMYGKPGLSAPRYDLALLAPRVLGARVPEVRLSEDEEDLPEEADDRLGTIIFWSVLVLVLVVLLGLLARLLRRVE